MHVKGRTGPGPAPDLPLSSDVNAVVSQAQTRFAALDDGTGLLDAARIQEIAQWVWASFYPGGKLLSTGELEAEAMKLRRQLDVEDGKMSFAEFGAYLRRAATLHYTMRRQEKRNGMQTLTKQLVCSSAGPVDGPCTAEPSLKAVSHEKRKARESASRRASAIPSESPKADELDAGCSMAAVVRRANKRFAALDREGTGLLDRERIKVLADCVWASVRPDGKELSASELEAELKHLQRRLDAADDGQMDFGEFEAYLRRRGANISKQRQLSMRRKTELKPPNQRLMQKSMRANESLHCKLSRSSGGAEKKPDADSLPLLAAVRQGDLRAVEARFLLCSQYWLCLPTSHACRH